MTKIQNILAKIAEGGCYGSKLEEAEREIRRVILSELTATDDTSDGFLYTKDEMTEMVLEYDKDPEDAREYLNGLEQVCYRLKDIQMYLNR